MDKFQTICKQRISIHAPREGSDCPAGCPPRRRRDFYPRSPRGERPGRSEHWRPNFHFYPRSPRGERQQPVGADKPGHIISIHAPREGSDPGSASGFTKREDFYPRSPRGERPLYATPNAPASTISIHAPREGSDHLQGGPALGGLISIHAPREGSDATSWVSASCTLRFLSTLPARGATIGPVHRGDCMKISIHAPREGSDCPAGCPPRRRRDFYPRSPRGERPGRSEHWRPNFHFYPRSPRGERRALSTLDLQNGDFYPRSPRGERRQ